MTDTLPPPSESWLQTLDRALRGGFTETTDAADTATEVAALPVGRLLRICLALGVISGICIGSYQLFHGDDLVFLRIFANTWKVPLLFVLTVLVTVPSLYVFAALQRMDVSLRQLMSMLLLSVLVHLCVLASLGPVFAFFAASTNSYPFLLLLNVLFWGIAGVLGVMVLRKAAAGSSGDARRVVGIWCVIYGIVGAQMGWLLRPFLGKPGEPFALFCAPAENVLIALLQAFADLFR